jgi:hypothetical protein
LSVAENAIRMGAAMGAAPVDARRNPPAVDALSEWQSLAQGYCPNLLIVGELGAREREDIVQAIQARCGLDVFHVQDPQGLLLLDHGDVILVIDDACRLSDHEQRRLLRWIDQHGAQITSFASHSLYDMVRAGSFMKRLYYHLNTIYVALPATTPRPSNPSLADR